MTGNDTREKALDVLKKQIREQKKRIDPAVLARAQEALAAKGAAAASVPYDRETARAAVEIFLKDHADAEGFSRKLAKKLHQDKN
ncbi:MAG: hypothetical protein ACAH80_12260 [Alphaproteobacteria bacterium]